MHHQTKIRFRRPPFEGPEPEPDAVITTMRPDYMSEVTVTLRGLDPDLYEIATDLRVRLAKELLAHMEQRLFDQLRHGSLTYHWDPISADPTQITQEELLAVMPRVRREPSLLDTASYQPVFDLRTP